MKRLTMAHRLQQLPKCHSLEQLRQHLQVAIELEHSTLPPYLCALYTIKPNTNREAANLVRSVLMEEMLHMTLAANVLNAIGGNPAINQPDFVPEYPTPLPESDQSFIVNLERFSKSALDTFIRIELPTPHNAPPAEWEGYQTIGQFYTAIENALKLLEASAQKEGKTIFTGNKERQIGPNEFYYGGGGDVVPVDSLETALKAINLIIVQGEGVDDTIWDGLHVCSGERRELAHYYRFIEVRKSQYYKKGDVFGKEPTGPHFEVDWDQVYPMVFNPPQHKEAFSQSPGLMKKYSEFNILYTHLLNSLHKAFNGRPDELIIGVKWMFDLKEAALELVKIPVPGKEDCTAGPGFEFVQL